MVVRKPTYKKWWFDFQGVYIHQTFQVPKLEESEEAVCFPGLCKGSFPTPKIAENKVQGILHFMVKHGRRKGPKVVQLAKD